MSTRRRAPSPALPGADSDGGAPPAIRLRPESNSQGRTTRSTSGISSSTTSSIWPTAGPRERFEAFARSVRDILSQRWVLTEDTYERENPKRVYYLSMEFLIGRSLANNVTNLLLDPMVQQAVTQKNLDWLGLARSRNPTPGLGNGGLGRLAACFLDSMATHAAPGDGLRPALRVRHLQADPSRTAGNTNSRTTGCVTQTPGRSPRPHEKVEVKLNCSFEVRGGTLQRDPRPAVEPDRHPVRSPGGRLRRQDHQHAPALGRRGARLLRLSGLQPRRLRRRGGRDARGRIADPRAVSRRLHEQGAGTALRAGVFPGRLLAGRSRAALPARATPTGARFPRRSPSSSTIRIRRWRSPS